MLKALTLSVLIILTGSQSHAQPLTKSDFFECFYAMNDAVILIETANKMGLTPTEDVATRFMNATSEMIVNIAESGLTFTAEDEEIMNNYTDKNKEIKSAVHEGILVGIAQKQRYIDAAMIDLISTIEGCDR